MYDKVFNYGFQGTISLPGEEGIYNTHMARSTREREKINQRNSLRANVDHTIGDKNHQSRKSYHDQGPR